jgi:hypothetical protein
MNTTVKRALRFFPALGASLAFIFSPSLGLAQQDAPMPPYAVAKDDVIRGTIANFDGATTIYVRDVRGYVDNVTLHKGTIINPTGIRLQPGYPVTISGHPAGSTFVADQIDTPFRPAYIYGPAYAYPMVGLGWGWGWHGWR